jgi:hypothetical protein
MTLGPRRAGERRPAAGRGGVGAREQQIGGSGGPLEPPGPLLEPPGPLLTHLHTVCMAYSGCLPTRLNPLAERTCFSQAGAHRVGARRERGAGGRGRGAPGRRGAGETDAELSLVHPLLHANTADPKDILFLYDTCLASETDAELAQKLGQFQPFLAVFL